MRALDWRSGAFAPMAAFRWIGGLAADTVFPRTCMACGVFVQRDGALCPVCWPTLDFVEHPLCDILGVPFPHDGGDRVVSPAAIANPPVFEKARAAVLFGDTARQMVHRLKYKDRADLAGPMARWMVRGADGLLEECDMIVPVPLHRWRLFTRRYNQSAELARAVAAISGIPYKPAVLTRKKATRQQVGLGLKARQANVAGAFSVPDHARAEIVGARTLLIDDVYTTGATLNAASRALKRAGAARVSVLTFARVSEPEHPS